MSKDNLGVAQFGRVLAFTPNNQRAKIMGIKDKFDEDTKLRITEEPTLPEYLIAELLRLQVELRDAEVKVMVLEPRLQVEIETSGRLRSERNIANTNTEYWRDKLSEIKDKSSLSILALVKFATNLQPSSIL